MSLRYWSFHEIQIYLLCLYQLGAFMNEWGFGSRIYWRTDNYSLFFRTCSVGLTRSVGKCHQVPAIGWSALIGLRSQKQKGTNKMVTLCKQRQKGFIWNRRRQKIYNHEFIWNKKRRKIVQSQYQRLSSLGIVKDKTSCPRNIAGGQKTG